MLVGAEKEGDKVKTTGTTINKYEAWISRHELVGDVLIKLRSAVRFDLLLAQERQHHQNDVLNIGQEGEDRVGLVATMQVMM